MNFLIILGILLVIVVLLVLFKFKELRHQFSLIFIVLLVLFLLLSVGTVFTKNKIDLKTFDGVLLAGKLYFSWLGSMFNNVVHISGYAINQEWDIGNSTQVTNITAK